MKPFQSLFDSLPTSALLATRASPLAARTPTCFAFFPTVLEEKRDCSQSMEIHEKDKRIDPNEDQDFCFCGYFEKGRFAWPHKEPF